MPNHILLTGEIGAGKSTLARRLLAHTKRPLYGFITERIPINEYGAASTYIHAANTRERHYTQHNLVGYHDGRKGYAVPAVFDSVGVPLLSAMPDGLLLMDELGFFESDATRFCDSVLQALDASVPVLAVVKARQTPFLDQVRAHQDARLFTVTPENRDALYDQILPLVLAWNEETK
jgi:nucleoside-triphosphatase THEP1